MSDEQNEPGPSGVDLSDERVLWEKPGKVEHFQRRPSDQELAQGHKVLIKDVLDALVLRMEAARRDGFYTEFNVNPGPYGAYSLQALNLVKRF